MSTAVSFCTGLGVSPSLRRMLEPVTTTRASAAFSSVPSPDAVCARSDGARDRQSSATRGCRAEGGRRRRVTVAAPLRQW